MTKANIFTNYVHKYVCMQINTKKTNIYVRISAKLILLNLIVRIFCIRISLNKKIPSKVVEIFAKYVEINIFEKYLRSF